MKPLDQTLYDTVVDCCAMRPDLEMLPGGDQTEIGEKVEEPQALQLRSTVDFSLYIVLRFRELILVVAKNKESVWLALFIRTTTSTCTKYN